MPLRRDVKHLYGPTWQRQTRPRIQSRAGNCCEQCGVPNGITVYRSAGSWSRSKGRFARWYSECGQEHVWTTAPAKPRAVRIVCAVAHLDRTPGNDADANLRFLCQWCHLNYDRLEHLAASKLTRIDRKDKKRPLIAAVL
jgi:hypothetical protein